ncbi:hypothetical protein [Streptomyces salinarius]|uniref:hypothetical protein n=1 Tax=Streptomyces salinarius TaxID=2762598 RepID=UPI002852BDFF|nr:hypothetical protein [Streptomyces salinarius]
MPDPSTPIGVLVYSLLGAAVLGGLKWAYRKVATINVTTPLGMITAVLTGTLTAVALVALLVWLWLHVRLV